MIVVKATYRNETRKFSFEYNSLPTYYDLQTQLCRVFPLLNFRNFYLSQLLFSPNASQPGHILIAREVHDLEGYSASTKPHQRYFVNALLKFNVMDKQPLMSNPQNSVTRSPFATQNIARVDSGSNSGSAANSTKADSVTSVASTHSLAESIDQMNSSIQDLRKNLDKLTLATLGRSADPCTICNSPIGGLRYTCRNCDACVCSTCNLKGDYFCIVTSGVHSLNLAVAESSTFNASEIPSIPLGSFPNLAESYHPSTTDAFSPFNSTPLASSGASMQVDDFTRPTTPTPSIRAPPPPPVIHEGIICDGCQTIVEGTRHKCLDCPDYDMCSRCVIDGGLNNHDAAHEWISLDKPTRVIIHKPNNTTSSQAEDATIHNATCDLCDSVIVGQRYKCTTCPDFDTCKACFSIVNEQHPKHHFIRIDHPSAYIQQRDRPRARHPAFCDVCRKTIYGVRYKCMHTHCPDFDLCEDCEALPIPQHPPSHPFLKIRTSDVVIPMVVHGGPRQGSAIAPSGHLPRRGSVVMPTQMPLPRVKLPVRGSLDSVHLAGSNVPPESARPQTPVQEEPSVTPAFDTTSLPPADVKGDIESEFAHAEVQPFNSQRGEAEATSLPQSSSQSVKPEASQIFQPAACASPVVGSADAVSVAKESTSPVAAPAPWDLSRGLNILLQADIPSETEEEHSETNCSPDGAPATPETKEISGVKNEWPNATVLSAEAPALPPLESLPTLPSNLFAPALNGSVLSTLFSPPTPPPVIEATLPSAQSEPSGNDEAINLSASCLGNVTVPDRQVFPPGSTFVKCWKMVNDGNCDWPADTRITFVGGDSFLSEQTATFLIGQAKCGEVRNVWTGELKAPEVPGRYMSYWRLRDENGTAFGQPVWIDIEVLEPLSRNLEDNLSSSSVVVMPNLEAPVAPPDSPKSASTSPSVATEDDGALSDTSFVSVGSSSDDEDADLWTDSRHQVPSTQQETQGVDYVLLYDDNTSDEDL